MNELIAAAKAVIANWDCVSHAQLGYYVEELRDAIDRAEKQNSVGFDKWWKDHGHGGYYDSLDAWTAAQQAERERFKEIIGELLDPIDPWIHYSTLLEKIDAPAK